MRAHIGWKQIGLAAMVYLVVLLVLLPLAWLLVGPLPDWAVQSIAVAAVGSSFAVLLFPVLIRSRRSQKDTP